MLPFAFLHEMLVFKTSFCILWVDLRVDAKLALGSGLLTCSNFIPRLFSVASFYPLSGLSNFIPRPLCQQPEMAWVDLFNRNLPRSKACEVDIFNRHSVPLRLFQTQRELALFRDSLSGLGGHFLVSLF